jgi:hypothetical protein
VAELQVFDNRPLNEKNKNRMTDSLKSVAQRLGAQGIVILKEQETVTVESLPASGGATNVYKSFIIGLAVVYE